MLKILSTINAKKINKNNNNNNSLAPRYYQWLRYRFNHHKLKKISNDLFHNHVYVHNS